MKSKLGLLLLAFLVIAIVNCEKEDITINENGDAAGETMLGIDTMTTASGIQFVRTPDEQFENLPDWPYGYQYVEIDGLRQAYAEAGPMDGEVVLLLHGQPSWSYLYRKMMPLLADAGYRVIAMDHLGTGRSDKPIGIDDYTYLDHNHRLEQFIQQLGLQDINLFVQDWGSLIGLRVAGLNPDWFATIAVGNGMLPVAPAGLEIFPLVENPNDTIDMSFVFADIPDQQIPYYDGCTKLQGTESEELFADWMTYAMKASSFNAAEVLEAMSWYDLPADVEAAYNAPFPSRAYMAGIRKFPSLINEVPGQTEVAYAGLANYEKPFLTIWGGNDPGNLGSCQLQQSFIDNVPGALGKPHARLGTASHFLQEDEGVEIARRLVEFYSGNYDGGNFDNDLGEAGEETCESDPEDDPRRYCEILLAYFRNGGLVAEVWGTQGLNTCSASCVDDLNLEQIQAENNALLAVLNGPRIWLAGGSNNNPRDEERLFGDLEMGFIAEIPIDPSQLTAGVNIPAYTEGVVFRNTVYNYAAGTMVYELTSPEGAIYTMQSMLIGEHPGLEVSDLPTLESMLNLPDGWSYEARSVIEDLILITDGEAIVIQDDLGNSYQKRLKNGSKWEDNNTL